MKININANHIRIYKLLNFIPDKNIDFICHFLKMNKQNVILYIKQIYYIIEDQRKNTTLSHMIEYILENKSIFKILKDNQIFTKEDRIFYIILMLLKHHDLNLPLNLNTLPSTLNISRRTLSDDLISVKKSLKFYQLEIYSISSKGINISGDDNNIKNCFLSYYFKFLVEIEELPFLMSKSSLGFFKQRISDKIIHDIEYFVYAFDFDIFINNKKLLQSVYRTYFQENCQDNISTLSFDEFKKYFSEVFTKKILRKLIFSLKLQLWENFL